MDYVFSVLWFGAFAWIFYFFLISPILKKPERMELVDIIEDPEEGFSFFYVGTGLTLAICYFLYVACIPIFCVVQVLTGHAMGFGTEREFIFRKENGEILSLKMRKNDLKFFGSSNYLKGDICNVKHIGHMLQRARVDKKCRMETYQQVYGNSTQQLSTNQEKAIEN